MRCGAAGNESDRRRRENTDDQEEKRIDGGEGIRMFRSDDTKKKLAEGLRHLL